MPLIGQLNDSDVGLGSPGLSRVDPICNKAICISDLVSFHWVSHILIKLIFMLVLGCMLIGLMYFVDRELTVIISNAKVFLLCRVHMSAPVTSHVLPGTSWWIIFPLATFPENQAI